MESFVLKDASHSVLENAFSRTLRRTLYFDHLNEDVLGIIVEYLLLDTETNPVLNLGAILPQVRVILGKDFLYLRILQNKLDIIRFEFVKKHWTLKSKWSDKITLYILFSKFISKIHKILLDIDDKNVFF